MEFEHAANVAEQAAREAGQILQDWSHRFTAREKSRANLVTEADLASQDAIHKTLSGAFPDFGFLGEEGLLEQSTGVSARWIIDPLDGTGNYVHRFPYYCVSIALEYKGELAVGIIFDPNRNELFRAVRGGGAFINDERLEVSDHHFLAEAMVVASLPVAAQPDDPAVARFLRVMPKAQSVQRTGSAALNLCNVAAGRLDGFWSTSLHAWDMAAGVLIVSEAGGKISQISGAPFVLDQPNLLATNGHILHTELQELLESPDLSDSRTI